MFLFILKFILESIQTLYPSAGGGAPDACVIHVQDSNDHFELVGMMADDDESGDNAVHSTTPAAKALAMSKAQKQSRNKLFVSKMLELEQPEITDRVSFESITTASIVVD